MYSIPWNLPTIFHPDLIATILQTYLLSLCVLLSQQSHPMRSSEQSRTGKTSNSLEISWNDWWLDNVYFISSNVNSSREEALLYIFEDNEAVIKMSWRNKPHNETRFQEFTELLLIGCFWTPKSKSNTLTPRTNSQTYWQREISHVMNGIIFCVCSTSAISVPPKILKWCRKEHQKMQVKKESQQNQSRWWIWCHDTAWGIRMCLPRLHRKARGKPNLRARTCFWAR